MRIGREICYTEGGREAIPFRPEDVIAVSSMRGPVNDIYLRNSKDSITDRKDPRKSFLDKIMMVCPWLTEEISSERRDVVWLLDPGQIDWVGTSECNATVDLILKSGDKIELRASQFWKLARDCGTEDMIQNGGTDVGDESDKTKEKTK